MCGCKKSEKQKECEMMAALFAIVFVAVFLANKMS